MVTVVGDHAEAFVRVQRCDLELDLAVIQANDLVGLELRAREARRSDRADRRARITDGHRYPRLRRFEAAARDVAILVNNAGSGTGASLLTGDLADVRLEMDTHFFGTLAVTRAFAPQLAEHEHSAVLNVLSALSWVSLPNIGAYCAAKAAEWSLTNALRAELAPQGTRVSSLHVGYMDTDLARHVTEPKSDPADIARIALDGIEAGETEIVADEISKQVLAGLSGGVRGLYPRGA